MFELDPLNRNAETKARIAMFYADHNYPLLALAYRYQLALAAPPDERLARELEYADSLTEMGVYEGALSRISALTVETVQRTAILTEQLSELMSKKTHILERAGRQPEADEVRAILGYINLLARR